MAKSTTTKDKNLNKFINAIFVTNNDEDYNKDCEKLIKAIVFSDEKTIFIFKDKKYVTVHFNNIDEKTQIFHLKSKKLFEKIENFLLKSQDILIENNKMQTDVISLTTRIRIDHTNNYMINDKIKSRFYKSQSNSSLVDRLVEEMRQYYLNNIEDEEDVELNQVIAAIHRRFENTLKNVFTSGKGHFKSTLINNSMISAIQLSTLSNLLKLDANYILTGVRSKKSENIPKDEKDDKIINLEIELEEHQNKYEALNQYNSDLLREVSNLKNKIEAQKVEIRQNEQRAQSPKNMISVDIFNKKGIKTKITTFDEDKNCNVSPGLKDNQWIVTVDQD